MNKEQIQQALETLSPESLAEVAQFIESLQSKQQRGTEAEPMAGLGGLWEGVEFTEEDIAEARREMWGSLGSDAEG